MATQDVTVPGARADGRTAIGGVRRLATEIKQSLKTTEFWAFVALVVGILTSAALINGGDNGN
jgi:hypothetical protein